MRPKLVVGCGSGRSGTFSLYRLLQAQKGFISHHEGFMLPWYDPDLLMLWRHLERMRVVPKDVTHVASTSFVWINYVSEVMQYIKDPRFICLKRDREKTVESFASYLPDINVWTDEGSEHWDGERFNRNPGWFQWPKYDLPRKEAIGAYWDEYYHKAEFWANKHPECFRIFNTEDLNTDAGVTAILNHAGVWDEEMVTHVNVRLNTRTKPKGRINNV